MCIIFTWGGCQVHSQDFSKGGSVCQSQGTHQIVVLSSPDVSCLLKGLQKGVKGTLGPLAMPISN